MSRIRLRDSVQTPSLINTLHNNASPQRETLHESDKAFLFSWKMTLSHFVEVHFFSRTHFSPHNHISWKSQKIKRTMVLFYLPFSVVINYLSSACSQPVENKHGNIMLTYIWRSYLCQVNNLEFQSPSSSTCRSGKWDQKPLPSAGGGVKDLQDRNTKDWIAMLLQARSFHQVQANSEVWHFRLCKWPRVAKCRPPTTKACGVCRCVSGSWLTEHLAAITAHL